MKADVTIIGGGIAGIQSAIDIADMGYKTLIVEKLPYIGGNAAKLGKFFPTNDCALCVMASSEVSESDGFRKCFYRIGIESHPNIEILTQSRLIDYRKKSSKYQLKINQEPRFVNENCINCGKCEDVCKKDIENPFNFGLDKQKVIHLPFFQSIPRRYIIDRDNCDDCKGFCKDICPVDAINLDDKEKEIEIETSSILVSTGFNEFTNINKNQFGYGIYKNVITQLELARLLDPTGPTKGEVISNETNKPVTSLSMILCVGSRDIHNNKYCSKICCTYSLKHALMLREKGIEVKVFYMDIRTFGEYEKYFIEARENGVTFIRGNVAKIEQDPVTKKLVILAENTLTSELVNIEEDLVVLTPGLIPSNGSSELFDKLKINKDEFGFVKIDIDSPNFMSTNQSGIFVAGTAAGPKDVPTSIMQANAASINIVSYLKRNKEVL